MELFDLSLVVNQDLWIATIENSFEALVSCSINCRMMSELWNRVHRNYKKCFDSLWEKLFDLSHCTDTEQRVSLSESNLKFCDYVMKTSF